MEAILGTLVIAAVVAAFLAYQRSIDRESIVTEIGEDDEAMIKARDQARQELPRFRELLTQPHDRALAKAPVKSSQGIIEWMWGDVRDVMGETIALVFNDRPATHRGSFQNHQSFPMREVADWLIIVGDMRIGGYTQRVTFGRMRAAGKLTGDAAKEASKYD